MTFRPAGEQANAAREVTLLGFADRERRARSELMGIREMDADRLRWATIAGGEPNGSTSFAADADDAWVMRHRRQG